MTNIHYLWFGFWDKESYLYLDIRFIPCFPLCLSFIRVSEFQSNRIFGNFYYPLFVTEDIVTVFIVLLLGAYLESFDSLSLVFLDLLIVHRVKNISKWSWVQSLHQVMKSKYTGSTGIIKENNYRVQNNSKQTEYIPHHEKLLTREDSKMELGE